MITRLMIWIGATSQGATAALGDVRRQVTGLAKDAKTATADFDRMMRSFRQAAALGAGAWGAQKLVIPGIKAAADLQAAMLALEAEYDGPRVNTDQMRRQLQEVQRMAAEVQAITSFDATGVVNIAVQLKKGGMSHETIVGGGAKTVAQLATAYGAEVSPERAGIMVSKLAGAMKITDPARLMAVLNDLTQTSSAASTNINALYEGVVKAAAVSTEFRVTPADLIAAIATMQGRGVQDYVAGEAMTAYLTRMAGAWADPEKRAIMKRHRLDMFNERGEFVGLERSIQMWRRFLNTRNDVERVKALQDMFGEEYVKSVPQLILGTEERSGWEALAFGRGQIQAGSYEAIKAQAREQADLERRGRIRMMGTWAGVEMIKGNVQTAMAVGFDPLNRQIREGIGLLDSYVSKTINFLSDSKAAQKTLSFAAPAAGLGLAVAATWKLVSGLRAGASLAGQLKSGWLGTLLGRGKTLTVELAQAKALEKMAGVVPVSVVNWPVGLGGGVADIAKLAGGAAGMARVPGATGGLALEAAGGSAGLALARSSAALFGKLLLPLQAYFAARDAMEGWSRARQIMGLKPEERVTLGHQIDAAMASLASGLTFNIASARDIAQAVEAGKHFVGGSEPTAQAILTLGLPEGDQVQREALRFLAEQRAPAKPADQGEPMSAGRTRHDYTTTGDELRLSEVLERWVRDNALKVEITVHSDPYSGIWTDERVTRLGRRGYGL